MTGEKLNKNQDPHSWMVTNLEMINTLNSECTTIERDGVDLDKQAETCVGGPGQFPGQNTGKYKPGVSLSRGWLLIEAINVSNV